MLCVCVCVCVCVCDGCVYVVCGVCVCGVWHVYVVCVSRHGRELGSH